MANRSILGDRSAPIISFIDGNRQPIESIVKQLQVNESSIFVVTGYNKKELGRLENSLYQGTFILIDRSIELKPGHVYGIPKGLRFRFFDQHIELEKSHAFQWEDLQKNNLNEIYLLDSDLKFIDANQIALENLALSLKELRKLHIYEIFSGYTKASYLELMDPLARDQKEKLVFKGNHQRSNGSLYPVECALTKITHHKKTVFFYRAIDISRHEDILQAIRVQSEHLQALASNFPSGSITLFDAQLNILYSGGEAYGEFRIDPQQLIGKNAKDFLSEELYELLLNAKKMVVTESSHTYESRYNGRLFRNTLKPIYGEKGHFRYYIFTALDNTILKEQQNKILVEKNNYAAISNALNRSALVLITDEKGIITDANRAFCETSKYRLNELIGKSYSIIDSGYHGDGFWKEMWATVSNGNTWRAEVRNRARDGSLFWVDTVFNPIYDIDGTISGYLAILYLITERKELEFNLLQITNKFVLASQAAGIGVWTFDYESREISWDIQIQGISELGFFKGDLKEWLEFVHPEDKEHVAETINPKNINASEFELELRLISKSGTLHYINLKASVEVRERKSKRAIGLTWDVSREKLIQQNLEEALKDREIMYKELHHRIKNNLQMVNSLLYIRGTYTKDEEIKEFIKDTGTKINSISTIHEKLLQLSPMNQLNIKEYLTTLCHNVVRIYSDAKAAFTLNIDITPELFGVDTALNLGLITNEILSNSIKYAYPDGGGLVKVSLRKKNDHFIFKAMDQGIGFSTENRATPKASYGMQLIELFVRQIEGEMKIDHQRGTAYTIKFKKPKP